MDLNYINPFIESASEIIKEVCEVEIKKEEVYVRKGKESKNGVGIILDVYNDVNGRIILDLTNELTLVLAKKMIGLNISHSEELLNNKELIESAIKELGNMISGRAITLLEEKNYNCNITPPETYLGKNIVLADNDHICIIIDFTSEIGSFSLCLTNRADKYLETISFILFDINQYLEDILVFTYLPKGFEIFEIHDKNNLFKIISKRDIDFLLINTDKMGNNLINELTELKRKSKNENIRIIVSTSLKDISVFENLFDQIVSFVLPSYYSDKEIINSMNKFFEASGIRHSERRKHVRLDLRDCDFVKLTFSLNEGNTIEGKVINISLGGALFQCLDTKNIHKISIGKKFDGMQLNIDGRMIRVSSIVVYKKEYFVGIRFVEIKESFLKALSKYIFKKLSKAAESIFL